MAILVVGFPTSIEQWGECRTCPTLLRRPTVTTVVSLYFDNSSRRKVPFDLGGMHTKVMGVRRNKTVFAFHLIDQVVY